MIRPSFAKADMCQANRPPGKESRQARQREEPVKHHSTVRAQIDIRKQATRKHNPHREGRPPSPVDVGENTGRVAELRHGGKGARPAVDAGHADGHDGDDDDGVDEMVEPGEPGVLPDEHEGRGGHVTAGWACFAAAEEARVVGANEKAYEEEAEDIETL